MRAGADMTVLRPGRLQRDGLLGGLILVFVPALVRGLAGAQTSAGRVAVIVFAALVIAGLLAAWLVQLARPSRLEISGQAVTLVDAKGKRITLARQPGDELKVVVTGSGRYRRRRLTIDGSGTVIPPGFFSLAQIQRAATATAGASPDQAALPSRPSARGRRVFQPPLGRHALQPPLGRHALQPPRGRRAFQSPRGRRVFQPLLGRRFARPSAFRFLKARD